MRELAAAEIRGSIVNATDAELERLGLPDLASIPWEALDFLGWVDPAIPSRGYLVMDYADAVVGIALRIPVGGGSQRPRRCMCNLCHTVHGRDGVKLVTAPVAGEAGRHHNMVGTYVCADLRCSLYVRGLLPTERFAQLPESVRTQQRIARLRERLNAFVARVLAPRPVTTES